MAERMRALDDTSVNAIDEARRRTADEGRRLLERVASAECDRLYGVGRTRATRVRIVVVEPPPFSQRRLPDEAGATSNVDLDWAPYEPTSTL